MIEIITGFLWLSGISAVLLLNVVIFGCLLNAVCMIIDYANGRKETPELAEY